MRPLPWRKTYAPYEVWISEIMLQQTQMERGVAYFERWVQQFPNVAAVANANEDSILKAWEGLGYYSRARNLHRAAKQIMQEYGGAFPNNFEQIRTLAGIGDYTAGAIASIAFQENVIAVDANVERVFSRLYDIDTPVKEKATQAFLREQVRALLPQGKARLYNQALMELGALICGKSPQCAVCPVMNFCRAQHLGIACERPVPVPKAPVTVFTVSSGVLMHNGHIFLQQRPDKGLWANFWEFPGGKIEDGETPEDAIIREFAEELELSVRVRRKLTIVRHGYTRYRVTLHCFLLEIESPAPRTLPTPPLHAATQCRWIRPEELASYTLPAGHRKLADMLAEKPEMLEGDGE